MRFYPNSGKPIYKAIFVAFICAMLSNRAVLAQTIYQPYTYQFYQKFSDQLYNSGTNLHTAIKPYFIEDTLLKRSYDSMMQIGSKNNFFNEHLFNKSGNGYELYSDVLPDVQIGNGTWVTSLGYQVGGNIGKKFSFYGSIYENRARFPNYLENIINSTYYIPGEGKDQDPGQPVKSWLYSSFLLSYSLTKFVNFTLGKDKTFIGDGYRSMLLSDAASNYPFFKTTVTLGNVKYMTMYAYLDDPNAPKVPGSAATRTKWGYFQYIDWNVSKKVSIGFLKT